MKNELFEQWVTLTKEAAEPMMKLNELSARAMEQTARQQLELARDYLDLGARQVQLMGNVQDPQKWLSDQSELANEFSKKLTGRAEAFVVLANKTQKELSDWAEQNASKAKEKMGKVV
ncbi:hypothetical protein CCP3SC1_900002 [Gammaproteobacteria bacterium]